MGHAEPDEEDELLTEFYRHMQKAAFPFVECGFLYIENPWLDQGFDKALAMSL